MTGREDGRDDGLDVPDPARLLAERAQRERTASGSWRPPSRERMPLEENLDAFPMTDDPDTEVTPPTAIPGTMNFDLDWDEDDGRTFDDALIADADAPRPLSGHVEPSPASTAAPTWDDAMAAEEASGSVDPSVGEPVGTAVPDRGTAVDAGGPASAAPKTSAAKKPPARRGPSTTGVLVAVIFFLVSVVVVLLAMR